MNKTIHELEEITQAEATDELIVFDVSDAKSKKVQVQNLVGSYSTSETFTGQYWIDGKPIYRKCYQSATNFTQYQVIDTISNIAKLVNAISIAFDTSSNEIVGSLPEGQNSVYLTTAGDIRALRSGIFVNTSPSTIVIEYTKAT